MQIVVRAYRGLMGFFAHFDGAASLCLRLILAPVLLMAGLEKLTGENWFVDARESFPFPFDVLPPTLSWYLAAITEFAGGILLLLGLGVRLIAGPLMVTMFVAAWAVHWDNGWAAIAPSRPAEICVDQTAAEQAGAFERWLACYNVNERTIAAAERLDRAKSLLKEHGNWDYLSARGSFAKLNNGIEFAAMYFAMLFALLVIGGGRYLSLDWWLGQWLRRFQGDAAGIG